MSSLTAIAGYALFFWTLKQASDIAVRVAARPKATFSTPNPSNFAEKHSYDINPRSNFNDIGYVRDDYEKEANRLDNHADPMLLKRQGWIMNPAEQIRTEDTYRTGAVGVQLLDKYRFNKFPVQPRVQPKFYNVA